MALLRSELLVLEIKRNSYLPLRKWCRKHLPHDTKCYISGPAQLRMPHSRMGACSSALESGLIESLHMNDYDLSLGIFSLESESAVGILESPETIFYENDALFEKLVSQDWNKIPEVKPCNSQS